MHCSKCRTANPDDALFCEQCGAQLELSCPSCGALVNRGARFCRRCGTAVGTAAASGLAPRQSPPDPGLEQSASIANEGERKNITTLFADIKGSMEMMEHLDPEQARKVIDPALRIMMEAARRYGGHVVQSTGDGIFATFGAPLAYEDHPQRALHAALRMQDQLKSYSDRMRAEGQKQVLARVGVNTGEAVVRPLKTDASQAEYTPIGHSTGLAARMQTLAPIGSVAVTGQTKKLCDGYFAFKSLGTVRIRGVSEGVEVYEVTGLGPLRTHFQLSTERGLSKFVGREGELGKLGQALERMKDGHGQVVAVLGEPGVGKSRLFYEFKSAAQSECSVLEAFSLSYGATSSYLPVIEMLRSYFGIAVDDDKRRRREKRLGQLLALDSARVVSFGRRLAREKVVRKLRALDPRVQETLPYLFALLGISEASDPLAQMDPQIRRRRVLEAVKRLFLRESLERPLVLIFEDLHWIDSESQGLLDLLADSIANARVLLLVNYRPEYRHQWTNKSYYTHLRLDPLRTEGAEQMLAGLLADDPELAALKRMIVERAEGNPLFIEEMVQELFDAGALIRNGKVILTRALSQLRLPSTVQRILASRIDRLPGAQKELLQTLAVIGRESMLAVIRQVVSTDEAQLDRWLSDLQAGEFIYEQPTSAGVTYVFKHALTQEVAYNSILTERRELLHQRTAQALESIFADQLDDHFSELARHYGQSEQVSKAIEYLAQAGQQAMQRSAPADAITNLSSALALLERLPNIEERRQRELVLQLALGPGLIITRGWSSREVEASYSRARQLCEQLGDPPELFHVLFGLWTHNFLRGELRQAWVFGEELLQRAESAHDPGLRMFAHLALGYTSYQMGELVRARQYLEMAISLYDRERHRPLAFRFTDLDAEVSCLSYLAFTLSALGYSEQALKRVSEALALARAIPEPYSLVFAEYFSGGVHMYRREAREAQAHAEAVLQLCSEHGFTGLVGSGMILRGSAMTRQGRADEGIDEISRGLAQIRKIGARLGMPESLSSLGEALGEAGRFSEGLAALAEAEAVATEIEDRQDEAERFRIKGEILLRRDGLDSAEAEACFQHAIESARQRSAKLLELRATASLARLLASRGRRSEARAMLAEVYNWFSEGFETADLTDARALLEQLARSA